MNRRAISQLEALDRRPAAPIDEAGPSNIGIEDDNSDLMDVQTDATDAGGEELLPSIGDEGEPIWSDTEPDLQPFSE